MIFNDFRSSLNTVLHVMSKTLIFSQVSLIRLFLQILDSQNLRIKMHGYDS